MPDAGTPKTNPTPATPSTGPGDTSPRARLTPLEELQLVRACQKGDSQAVADLLQAFQHRVYGICYRMVRHADDAIELTQDVLIKIIEGVHGYDGRAAFSTWVVRVTMNACLSHIRRQKLRRHGSLDDPGPTGELGRWVNLADEGEPSPYRRVEQAELRSVLLRAMDMLEGPMRAVLVLRDVQGLDYLQISEVLDVPVGTVKSRLFRARTALREAAETLLSDSGQDA